MRRVIADKIDTYHDIYHKFHDHDVKMKKYGPELNYILLSNLFLVDGFPRHVVTIQTASKRKEENANVNGSTISLVMNGVNKNIFQDQNFRENLSFPWQPASWQLDL